MHKPFVTAVIAAAGNSTRMGSDVSKQLINVFGMSLIEYSLTAFSTSKYVDEIIVTAKEDEIDTLERFKTAYPKIAAIVKGGSTRQESVSNALEVVSEKSEIIAVHDAARPLITPEDIDGIIEETMKHGAVCPVSLVTDTVKKADNGVIVETLDRNTLFLASTPQAFKTEIYRKACAAVDDFKKYTDDCSIVESIGQQVHLYVMQNDNTKVTVPQDIDTIRHKLGRSEVRIGHGYDVHKLVEGRELIIGGVQIPHEKGLLGHSDADVLLHAIMDALLGAASLGDIGNHFPDTCDKYKGISSVVLLQEVSRLIREKGFLPGNIDATVVAQAPKLSPFIPEMVTNVAKALEIDVLSVNIKATTEEHLGFTGEKLGISAHAVCTLIR